LLQDLTFDSAKTEFKNKHVVFEQDKFRALGLISSVDSLYTNLALILSDQCTHSVKIAVFDDASNTVFKDRQEFKGSIFNQLNDSYTYCMLNNRTESIIRGLDRIDTMEYPPEAIREALLNAIVHRDYGFSGSIIININAECIQFISMGGLVPGLTTEDILSGISQPRNPMLAQIFFRLKHIEAYGTGLRRIYDLYRDCPIKPAIAVTDNSFRITLANMIFAKKRVAAADEVSESKAGNTLYPNDQMQKILNYVAANQEINEKTVMDLLHVKRTRAYIVTKQMTDLGLLQVQGRGKTKTYILGGRSF
jgi:ATP-dependent DNA helicase RecG